MQWLKSCRCAKSLEGRMIKREWRKSEASAQWFKRNDDGIGQITTRISYTLVLSYSPPSQTVLVQFFSKFKPFQKSKYGKSRNGEKLPLYCPQGSGTLRQQLLLMHGIAWYCIVLHSIAWYCIVLHGIACYCMVLHDIAWYCMVLNGIELFCTILHHLAPYCNMLHHVAPSYTILHYLALSCTFLHYLAVMSCCTHKVYM